MSQPRISLRQIGSVEVRPPSWLVQGLLIENCIAAIYGPVSVGKSFLALSLSVCVATGRPFFGRKIGNPGLVVYVAGEGHDGIIRRYDTWCKANNIDAKKPPLLISDCETELCDSASVEALENRIKDAIQQYGPLRLLVIDTWSRNLAGDDNSQVDSERGVKAFSSLCKPWRAVGLIIAHEGYEKGRIRGSSALKGDLDLEIWAHAYGKDAYSLTMTKGRDIPTWRDFRYRIASVEHGLVDADGMPIESGIIEEISPADTNTPAQQNEKEGRQNIAVSHKERALAILAQMQEEKSGGDGSIGLVNADEWRGRCLAAIPSSSFYDAKAALREQGVISLLGEFVMRNPTANSL